MKDLIQEIEERQVRVKEFKEKLLKMNFSFPEDAKKAMSQWKYNLDALDLVSKDVQNLLKLVKAYEEIARELVNSDGVVSVDQEQQTVTVMCLEAQDKIFGKDSNE